MGIKEFGNGIRSDSHSLLYPQVAEGTMIPLVSVNLPTNRECSSFSLHSCSLQYHEGKTSSGQLKLFTLYCISWSRFIFTNRTRLTQWDRHVSNLLPLMHSSCSCVTFDETYACKYEYNITNMMLSFIYQIKVMPWMLSCRWSSGCGSGTNAQVQFHWF